MLIAVYLSLERQLTNSCICMYRSSERYSSVLRILQQTSCCSHVQEISRILCESGLTKVTSSKLFMRA